MVSSFVCESSRVPVMVVSVGVATRARVPVDTAGVTGAGRPGVAM